MQNNENETNSNETKKQASRIRLSKDKKIIKARTIHGNRYDYSHLPEKFKVIGKVPIICSKHGLFEQTWDNHINSKQGCPKCAGMGLSLEEKISQANEIHDHKYDYSKLPDDFLFKDKVSIGCYVHGYFKQM